MLPIAYANCFAVSRTRPALLAGFWCCRQKPRIFSLPMVRTAAWWGVSVIRHRHYRARTSPVLGVMLKDWIRKWRLLSLLKNAREVLTSFSCKSLTMSLEYFPLFRKTLYNRGNGKLSSPAESVLTICHLDTTQTSCTWANRHSLGSYIFRSQC